MGTQLILVSHGTLCEELKRSTEMIMGEQPDIQTLSLLESDGPEDFRKKFLEATKGLHEYIVMADLLGGTPCNVVAKELMLGAQFDLYAGMNMPMVVSFINGQLTQTKGDLVQEAKENIYHVNELLVIDDEDE
ncbi:PTS system, mannose-specific IIA component [Enterococcus sp. AZ194]|uniref:PTS sugar transporter subunit IIA n=1 Tax=Enterococcus sp. AZ194 TaxID=2774629 RepID=UPI003F28B466